MNSDKEAIIRRTIRARDEAYLEGERDEPVSAEELMQIVDEVYSD